MFVWSKKFDTFDGHFCVTQRPTILTHSSETTDVRSKRKRKDKETSSPCGVLQRVRKNQQDQLLADFFAFRTFS